MATTRIEEPEPTVVQKAVAKATTWRVRDAALLAWAAGVVTLAPFPFDALTVAGIVALAWDMGKRR